MSRAAKIDPALARQMRLDALLALMPAGLADDVRAEWMRVSEALADDPPGWAPSPRYRDLVREYCVEGCHVAAYRSALRTINLEIYREKAGAAERVKVHPFVGLLDNSLKRWRELSDMLELSPRSVRKRESLFDAA